MPTYVFRNLEVHTVITERFEEFDTSDQEHWTELLERAKSNDIDIEDFPIDAPSDYSEWFDLLNQLPREELMNEEDENWVSMDKGGFEVEIILQDAQGNEIMRDD